MKKHLILASLGVFVGVNSSPHIPSISDLTLKQKIGQLIIAATISAPERNGLFISRSPYHLEHEYIKEMVQKYHVSGVIFMGASTPQEQVALTNQLQSMAHIPLLIGLDAEWGLSMRHQENVLPFPRAMTLGALCENDNYLIYELAKEIGKQCKAIGVHINFAPVADVNNNPRNPVINSRSFGENPDKVAQKAELFMRGLQDGGVMACGKHFPGHGDTDTDTHLGRAVVPHSIDRLHAIELYPFKRLIKKGIDAIMTAHIDVPSLSNGKHMPATLSESVLNDLLRNELQFEGLIITDGLGMKALTDDFAPGALELKALKAGNDILLCPVEVPQTITRIKKAVLNGELLEEEIDEHVSRVLLAKENARIQKSVHYNPSQLINDQVLSLKQKLYDAAITIARNVSQKIPIKVEEIHLITIGGNSDHFVATLDNQVNVNHVPWGIAKQKQFERDDQIIVSLHMQNRSGMIEMEQEIVKELHEIALFFQDHPNALLVLFGNPYNLAHFKNTQHVIVGYENEPEAQTAAAKVLLGRMKAHGILPVTPTY